MSEESVTVVPEFDDSAIVIVSAVEVLQSQISEAESVRVSESVAAASSVSESLSESLSIRADEAEFYRSSTETLVVMSLFIAVCFGIVSGILLVIMTKTKR